MCFAGEASGVVGAAHAGRERALGVAADPLGAYTMPLPSSSRAMMFFWISVVPS